MALEASRRDEALYEYLANILSDALNEDRAADILASQDRTTLAKFLAYRTEQALRRK